MIIAQVEYMRHYVLDTCGVLSDIKKVTSSSNDIHRNGMQEDFNMKTVCITISTYVPYLFI